MNLPYTRHSVDERDVAAVSAALRGDMLTCGPLVEAFEQALAREVGARHVVVCSSGTAALHLACLGLGLTSRDIAIVPTMTFLATANAPRMVGAEVVFADVDPGTGLVRSRDVENAIARADGGVGAVLPVHLNGQPAPMEAIAETARRHGLSVIEDGCHALGTRYTTSTGAEARIGDCRFSDATVFSFHPAKTIAAGEGGAVCTNDGALAAHVRRLRNHGMVHDPGLFSDPEAATDKDGEINPWYYEMSSLGYNYRLSDIHCALGLSQLAKLNEFRARRRELAAAYDAALASLAPVVQPVTRVDGSLPILHLYPVLIDYDAVGRSRAEVMRALRRRGVGTQVHYRPVHRQPYYRERYGHIELPGAEAYYDRVLSLPFFVAMRDADIETVRVSLADVLTIAGHKR